MESSIPIGFENIGNTCFANSVLQCLLHTPEMLFILNRARKENCLNKATSNIQKNCVKSGINKFCNKIEEEKNLFNSDNSVSRPQRVCKPTSFGFSYPEYCCTLCGMKSIAEDYKNGVSKPLIPLGLRDITKKVFGDHFKFGLQQDAHEFLIMLLQSMESSTCIKDNNKTLQREDDYEIDFGNALNDVKLSDVFEGSFTSCITCSKCKYTTKNKQQFQDINLNIQKSFEDSMKEFFSHCKLEGNNQYECSKCKKYTDAVKKLTLDKEPNNLIINLKKYDKFGAKIKASDIENSCFEYPLEFKLDEYVPIGDKRSHSNRKSLIYELYGVINHEGKFSNCGHYNCYVKGYDGNWYICDDSKVKRIYDISDVPTSKAYVLFYKLKGGSIRHQLITRRPSNVSTVDLDSETRSISSYDSDSSLIVSRKKKKKNCKICKI